MPVIKNSQYRPPLLFSNGHLQTIYANVLRRLKGVSYRRERIDTPDGDFLDLDWSIDGSKRLAILSHGLGGNSYRPYILGMAQILRQNRWDVLAWNFRGCGGEPNLTPFMTHSGATEDLETVLRHAASKKNYREIVLIGFSLGGNLTLKYLGERGKKINSLLKKAVVFSVPSHLESTAWQLAKLSNVVYMKRFLLQLRQYVREKKKILPDFIGDEGFDTIRTFKDFDDRYVAPFHGFKNAEDYWKKSSADLVLGGIQVPTLMVNARNDPFLTPQCFPEKKAKKNPYLFLETPDSGGHVGFVRFGGKGEYWSESRAMAFLEEE
ncbi:MAG: alpha/beta fold hydrolase [bacterium]